jgi:hypothetical protein
VDGVDWRAPSIDAFSGFLKYLVTEPLAPLGRDVTAVPCRCHDLPDCPEQATVEINAAELADVAELLDGFLRSSAGIADRLTHYLQTTARDPPTTAPPGANYNANLVIDLVSFTAHALRRQPSRLT